VKKEILAGINTIIFDLGEVIIDLHPEKVIQYLSRMWKIDANQIKSLIVDNSQLIDYETGRIDELQMLDSIQRDFQTQITVDEFEYGWNLMIGDISQKRKNLLEILRKDYQVLFLSNTNAMHERAFDTLAREKFSISSLSVLVDRAYYSHNMGLRKPDKEIYKALIDDQNLNPRECLFLDDRMDNILSASELGIKTLQITTPNQILGLI